MMEFIGKRLSTTKGKSKKGFTLIELVVVIAIMAILAAVMVPNLTAYIAKADAAVVKANMKTVHTAASLVDQTEDGELSANIEKVREYANTENISSVGDVTEGLFDVTKIDGVMTVQTSKNGVVFTFDGKAFTPIDGEIVTPIE